MTISGRRLLTAVGIAFTAAVCAVHADPTSYSFQILSTLGQRAPNGFHINDYEPGALNNRGDAIYGTDLGTTADPATNFGEGVFLLPARSSELELARATASAPGGGVFDFLLLGQTALNDEGDGAFAFTLSPFGSPVGANSGVYRYSQNRGTVTAVVRPGVTPAPAGGTFTGAGFNTSLNNRGDLVFTGIIATDKGVHVAGEPYIGLGAGVFLANKDNRISSVVSPGDTAPGGGLFDYAGASGAGGAWINQGGDVAFVGHVAGEPSVIPGFPPQSQIISALGSLYVKKGATGKITSIAHVGDAAPRGGIFRGIISPVMNDSGDVVFYGDISPAGHVNEVLGVYLFTKGANLAVARPGDPMPGGGTFVTAPPIGNQNHVNDAGDVVFNAVLSTDADHDGTLDTGLFVWSHGSLRLVARSGTVLAGVGTVAQLVMGVTVVPPPPNPPSFLFPNTGAANNARGQILFGATMSDGRGLLLLATP